MNGLIGLISLSALLLAVSGQIHTLSPSFSLQGTIVATDIANGSVLTGPYSASVDIVRRLQITDETLTTPEGVTTNIIELISGFDEAAFVSRDGVCEVISVSTDLFPIETDLWGLYFAGTEDPTGTYTFTLGGAIFQLTLDNNGRPGLFNYTSSTTMIVLTVTNFDNTIPAFSKFCLPSECSQFSCSQCYSSAVSASISILLLLTTLLMYLLTTL